MQPVLDAIEVDVGCEAAARLVCLLASRAAVHPVQPCSFITGLAMLEISDCNNGIGGGDGIEGIPVGKESVRWGCDCFVGLRVLGWLRGKGYLVSSSLRCWVSERSGFGTASHVTNTKRRHIMYMYSEGGVSFEGCAHL